MTSALRTVTESAVATHRLTRVFAAPYEWNAASSRVPEKVGCALEGRMRRSAIKDGKIIDPLLCAHVLPA